MSFHFRLDNGIDKAAAIIFGNAFKIFQNGRDSLGGVPIRREEIPDFPGVILRRGDGFVIGKRDGICPDLDKQRNADRAGGE
jgi:hypothetical protein